MYTEVRQEIPRRHPSPFSTGPGTTSTVTSSNPGQRVPALFFPGTLQTPRRAARKPRGFPPGSGAGRIWGSKDAAGPFPSVFQSFGSQACGEARTRSPSFVTWPSTQVRTAPRYLCGTRQRLEAEAKRILQTPGERCREPGNPCVEVGCTLWPHPTTFTGVLRCPVQAAQALEKVGGLLRLLAHMPSPKLRPPGI